MGYITYYQLNFTTPDGKDLPPDLRERIALFVEESEGFDGLREEFAFGDRLLGDAKMWEESEDMRLLSRTFPDVLFTLWGTGEEEEDLWVAYYLRGAEQFELAEIRFPPFDPAKLEEPAQTSEG